jgi:hypothetical protein
MGLMFVAGCAPTGEAGSEASALRAEFLSVTLERSPGLGGRPGYLVKIDAAGDVYFYGQGFVERATVPEKDLTRLIEAFADPVFAQLRNQYVPGLEGCDDSWRDSGSVAITLKTHRGEKAVAYYLGCIGRERDTLEKLADTIYQLSGSARWVER